MPPDNQVPHLADHLAWEPHPAPEGGETAADLGELAAVYFDVAYYLANNPDIRGVAQANPSFDPAAHYLNHGMDEGRQPSAAFDISYVQQWFARMERVEVSRRAAFRRFSGLPAARRFIPNRWFSPWAFRSLYAERYSELAALSDYALLEFYLRRYTFGALSPSGIFNEELYRARYQDVAVAIGQGRHRSGFMHFLLHGGQPPRVNLPGLVMPPAAEGDGKTAELRAREAEIAALQSGEIGFEPLVWWFDEAFYLSIYPLVHDAVRAGAVKSGLEHYLVLGFRQGRLPCPKLFRHLPVEVRSDPWSYFAALQPPPATAKFPLSEVCAMQRALRDAGHSPDTPAVAHAVAQALWPYAEAPALHGGFHAQHYLAVNTDVARSIGDAPEAALTHWRNFGRNEQRVAPGTNLFSDRAITFQDVLAWKSGVNFFGPVSSSSGLGTAARGYIAALRAADVPVDVYDTSSLIKASAPADLFCSESLAYSINFLCINADQVQAFATKYGTAIFNHRANVAAWVWELPAPRPEWRSVLSAFDLIVTPSQFCTDAFALFTDCPVRTVPYVVDARALHAGRDAATGNGWTQRIEAEKRAGRKIILFIMDASSYRARKGVDLFCELAARLDKSHPEQFCFVLKSHSKDVSLSRTDPYGPAVLSIDAVFGFDDLCRLKSLADLYVSPHRSEGFGLNIIESIYLGVPVLCSDYAGGTDLLAENDPPLVPVGLAEIGRDMGPYRALAIWADPDVESFADALLAFFERSRGLAAFHQYQRRLQDELSAAAVGARLKREMEKTCALGAESAPNRLETFRMMATARHDECFTLDYVKENKRRSSDAPGLARLGEIAMAAIDPFFSVVTHTRDTEPAHLTALYDDLLHQSYPSWEWCIYDDGSTRPETVAALRALRRGDARIKLRLGGPVGPAQAANAAVGFAQGKYLAMAGADDRLSPNLLASVYEMVRGEESGWIVYYDQDEVDPASGGDQAPIHKPGWSPEYLLSRMYVGQGFSIRKSVFLKLGGYRKEVEDARDHDLLLRAAAAHVPVGHIDRLLYHARTPPAPHAQAEREAVAAFLREAGIAGEVEPGLLPATCRVRPRLPAEKVVLNILTGCTRRLQSETTYVEQFVRSILAHAPALDFVIRVVVDEAAAADAEHLATLDPRVRVVPFTKTTPHFNFSEKANFALGTSGAERLVLLNDDMEALEADWLPALLEMLELPGVGIVGGQLLYADDVVQHAGIALGIHGATAHLFGGTKADFVGYNGLNKVIRNVSAVTGAMIALRRSTFERVGGFDVDFPIDYNDVDFCLRVAEIGLRTVYTPFATLRHFESRSAPRLAADALDRQRFCTRWAGVIARDPFYNRNLTRNGVLCERGR